VTTELNQATSPREEPQTKPHIINIFVEISGMDREIDFDHSPVTGAEIRYKAGVPTSDDLTRLVDGKPIGGNISPTDRIEIRNGEHFLAAPNGVVS
jgi:hypothetical protein